MKISIPALGLCIAAATFGHDAFGNYAPTLFANGMVIRNIGAMQHSIMTGALQSFEGSAASAMGGRAQINKSQRQARPAPKSHEFDPYMYGKMPLYGEYGDDGTVTGRSGGDAAAPGAHIWAGWSHYNDDVKSGTIGWADSPFDLIMAGISGNRTQISGGVSEWGTFGGYISGTQKVNPTKIRENGGHIGFYNAYKINNFNIAAAANFGIMYNKTETEHSNSDKFNNMWIGGAANLKYNMRISDSFTLQPGIYAGYTWVRSDNYTTTTGIILDNENLRMLEISPALRAIQHIGRGWFASIDARYAFNFIGGGETTANGMNLPELGSPDFVEYSIGLEKSIDRFNIAVNVGRHDGQRRGWNGGMSFKYLF